MGGSFVLLDDDLLDLFLSGRAKPRLLDLPHLRFDVGLLELCQLGREGHDLIELHLMALQKISSIHVEDLLGDSADQSALVLLQFVDALVSLPA